MFDYKPQRTTTDDGQINQLGWLAVEFEPFEPDSKYPATRWASAPAKDAWKTVVPKTAPAIGNLPKVIDDMVKMTWKIAEPTDGAQRGAPNHNQIFVGTRGTNTSTIAAQTYHKQIQPYQSAIHTKLGNKDALATDWAEFNKIQRTNAVTFRGDTRSPVEVIKTQGGFNPPNSRTDRYYLENGIYNGFAYYIKTRYGADVSQTDFLKAVDSAAPTTDDKKILADYVIWRQIMERESGHLGRMTDNELLKGYISTARAIDTAIQFGSNHHTKAGWLYLVVVHGGFIVPFTGQNKNIWTTGEGEIAQLGPVPSERIVGFRHLTPNTNGDYGCRPVGPIYVRRSFRKGEPEAFAKAFKIMSGKTP
jgi:hypothetical protein